MFDDASFSIDSFSVDAFDIETEETKVTRAKRSVRINNRLYKQALREDEELIEIVSAPPPGCSISACLVKQ